MENQTSIRSELKQVLDFCKIGFAGGAVVGMVALWGAQSLELYYTIEVQIVLAALSAYLIGLFAYQNMIRIQAEKVVPGWHPSLAIRLISDGLAFFFVFLVGTSGALAYSLWALLASLNFSLFLAVLALMAATQAVVLFTIYLCRNLRFLVLDLFSPKKSSAQN